MDQQKNQSLKFWHVIYTRSRAEKKVHEELVGKNAEVLKTDNVVCYITFEGKAAVIPESQINALKQMLRQYDFEVNVSTEDFEPGKKVEVIAGPLIGLQGELIEARGKNKFMLRFEQINSAFTVEVPADQLTLLPTS